MPVTGKFKRNEVQDVLKAFPVGCELRHIKSGALFTMGARSGTSGFWMMQLNPCRKGVVDASEIKMQYERVSA